MSHLDTELPVDTLTATDLHDAAFAVREFGEQCTTEFGQKYWANIADNLNAVALRQHSERASR